MEFAKKIVAKSLKYFLTNRKYHRSVHLINNEFYLSFTTDILLLNLFIQLKTR